MPDLLLEVGCEELPASFVARAHEELCQALLTRLTDAELAPSASESMGTPRRLIVGITGIPERQADSVKTVRGPSSQAAYDAEGKPSRALEGFCKGQGVDPTTAYVDGDYVWVKKEVAGQTALDILATLIPEAITSLTFSKTMRWAGHRLRFARPIRWILASFGGSVVPFSIEGVESGLKSRGHRFNFPDPFEAQTLSQLVSELRSREVEPSGDARVERVRSGVHAVAGGQAIADPALIEENAYLTEWPNALLGTFDKRYLNLPEPVLVTVMAKHERFFPVRGADGKLTNQFVSIRNGGVDSIVSEGNAWVLNARFSDAQFFYEEDKKYTIGEFLERTAGIVFQAELGTVRDRAERLADLCASIAESTGMSGDATNHARLAGLYAKADLSTGLVGELDELQGQIGGIYAEREGIPKPVALAIGSHYVADATDPLAMVLILADQLDKLAGYLGLGLTPSGSSDPYGLRRAAGICMGLALRWGEKGLSLKPHLDKAAELYGDRIDATKVGQAARDVLRQRCETLFPNAEPDIMEAVLVHEDLVFEPAKLGQRIAEMSLLAADVEFVQSATRPINIVAAAEKKGIPPVELNTDALDSAEGLALLGAARTLQESTTWQPNALKSLKAPIDAFFNSTMVMVDDLAVRDARLAMLREVSGVLLQIGDFSKLVIAG